MSKHTKHLIPVAVVAATLAMAGAARAEDDRPTGLGSANGGPAALDPKVPRSEAEAKLYKRHVDFKAAREQAKQTRRVSPPISRQPVGKPTEVRGVIERVFDGMALVGLPLQAGQEETLKQTGFRVAPTKDKIRDYTMFDGRMYRAIRLASSDWSRFERAVGQEVIATLQPSSIGGVELTAIRPVR
ncbi:hypothetical protein L6R52_08150 [Myxococcota bacterium]|nr:hypothetical protein [Myxococcota bacterium]